MKICVFLR